MPNNLARKTGNDRVDKGVDIIGFLQRRQDLRNLVGIGLTDEGIAIATISRDEEAAFSLTHTGCAPGNQLIR